MASRNHSAFRVLRSALCTLRSAFRRFCGDESGQGILFAAASLVLLVGFVALVYNVGRLTERRTKIQLAADAAAYSGAMVEANSLSTIGWINSAMAQIYYNSLKYAVDVNVTGVAAKMELILSQGDPGQGEAVSAFQEIVSRRGDDLLRAKQWMLDLSRIENAIAILTPRLVEEEMFAVAARAGAVAGRPAVERVSLYPSYRMFPLDSSSMSFLIEQFGNGWRITNLRGGSNEMVSIFLIDNEWRLTYSNDGIVIQEVVIDQEGPQRWRIRYYQPPGNLIQEIILLHDDQLGWVVWGSTQQPGGGTTSIPEIIFTPVDMDGDGANEGTRVTQGGTSQVFMRGPEGDLYLWSTELEQYVNMTSNQTEIGGVIVRINVTNVIRFPGGSAEIGDPTHVHVGRAHLVLRDPPTISTDLGPVHVSVQGFDPDSFNISVGGFSLRYADADGEWRKYYNRTEEFWWRHRLTEQEPVADALQQWQYDRQVMGAHLQAEPNTDRYIMQHAVAERFGSALPDWLWTLDHQNGWFDPLTARPHNSSWRHQDDHFSAPSQVTGIRRLLDDCKPPEGVYYLTRFCAYCDGSGKVVCPECNGADNNNDGVTDLGAPAYTRCTTCGGTGRIECPACHARDHDRDGRTDVRLFLADLRTNDPQNGYLNSLANGWLEYTEAKIHTAGYGLPAAGYPLVLAPEFFQFGMNVGAWRSPPSGMFAAASDESEWGFREPDWGYVAIASARVGVRDPEVQDGYRYDFVYSGEEREDWCNNSRNNLYSADVRAKLYPCRDQVQEYDLDRDLLIGGPIREIRESPLSYLWDAILGTHQSYQYNNWLDRYDGQSDLRVGAALRNMTNRRGDQFDFADEDLDAVVAH